MGTVTGSFSYNSSTHTLSSATLTINSSLFGNVTLTSVGVQGLGLRSEEQSEEITSSISSPSIRQIRASIE